MRRFWLVLLILPPVLALTVLSPFGQRLVTLIGIYALLGLGYQLVFGQLGALNLAQGALFGVGAYTAALAAPWLSDFSMIAAPLAAAAAAALVVGPILRLQSHYFALATLALASLVTLVAVNAESLTGGANGLTGFGSAAAHGKLLMTLVWIFLIVSVLVYAWLFSGPLGETARLLREAPLAAATLGIDGARWRFVAFVIGAAFAGFAGACSASLSGVVSPEATGFSVMLLCLTSVVLGGVRHPMGAVLGAALAVCLPELFRGLEAGWLLAYAAATLAVVLWAPQGLAGLIDRPKVPPVPVLPERFPPAQGARRLVLDRVTKRFGGIEALHDVSLDCRARRDRRADRSQWLGQDDAAQRDLWPGARRQRHHRARRHAPRAAARASDRPHRHRPHLPDAGGGCDALRRAGARAGEASGVPAARRARRRHERPRARTPRPICWAGCATRGMAC